MICVIRFVALSTALVWVLICTVWLGCWFTVLFSYVNSVGWIGSLMLYWYLLGLLSGFMICCFLH